MIKNIFSSLSVCIFLSGCAINGFYEGVHDDSPKEASTITKKNFIGIPPFLSFDGSSVKLDNEWRATVAHNKIILLGKEVYYHPRCDFALYREKSNDYEPNVGIALEKETLFLTGYPLFATYSSHKGKYIGEVHNPQDKCIYSGTDGTLIGGMSGGGVVDVNNNVVGVNVGIMYKNIEFSVQDELAPAIFISFLSVQDFIEAVIGRDLYPTINGQSNPLTESEIIELKKQVKLQNSKNSIKN